MQNNKSKGVSPSLPHHWGVRRTSVYTIKWMGRRFSCNPILAYMSAPQVTVVIYPSEKRSTFMLLKIPEPEVTSLTCVSASWNRSRMPSDYPTLPCDPKQRMRNNKRWGITCSDGSWYTSCLLTGCGPPLPQSTHVEVLGMYWERKQVWTFSPFKFLWKATSGLTRLMSHHQQLATDGNTKLILFWFFSTERK